MTTIALKAVFAPMHSAAYLVQLGQKFEEEEHLVQCVNLVGGPHHALSRGVSTWRAEFTI